MSRPENDSVQRANWNTIVIEAAKRPDTGKTSYFPLGIEEVGLISSIPFQKAIRSIIFESSELSAETKTTNGVLLARILAGLKTQQAIPTSSLQSIKDNNDAVATVANALKKRFPQLIETPAPTAVAPTSTDAPIRKKPQGPGLFKKALGLGAGALLTAAAYGSGALSGAPQTAPVFTPTVSATPAPTMEVSATPVPTVAATPLPVPQSTSDLDWYGTQRYPIETPSTALLGINPTKKEEREAARRNLAARRSALGSVLRTDDEHKDTDFENAQLSQELAETQFLAQQARSAQIETPADFDSTVQAAESTAENLASKEVMPVFIEEYVTPLWWIPLQDMSNSEKVRLVIEAVKILEKHIKNEELVPTSELRNAHLALEKDPETGTYSAHLHDTLKGVKQEGGAKFDFHKNWEDNIKFLETFLKDDDEIIVKCKEVLDSIVSLPMLTQVGISGYYPYLAVHEQIQTLEKLLAETQQREYLNDLTPLEVHEGGKKGSSTRRSRNKRSRSRRHGKSRRNRSRSRSGKRKSHKSPRYYAYM